MSTTWRDRLILASPLLAVALLATISPSDEGPTICPFALCTGMACPGCGMTRAAAHMFRGNLAEAVSYHPLVPLVSAQLLVAWGWFGLVKTGRVTPPSQRTTVAALVFSIAALTAVWIFRIVAGTLPPV